MSDDFEEECRQLRERNKKILESLGLDLVPPPKQRSAPRKPKTTRKRKAIQVVEVEQEGNEKPTKIARAVDEETGEETILRRSQRTRGKKVDYKSESLAIGRALPGLASVKAGLKEMTTNPRTVSKRIHDPKVFGAIPGIPVGTWWQTREECSLDAVHAPWVAGIAGGPNGAYSIALSGGYEDDIDNGNAFTYTGAGGRDLKGTKAAPKNLRTAPQSCDQSFDNPLNKALKKSSETKKPVRVIRGYKLDSPYAPSEGYRYDGLYTVEKAWMEKGLKGFMVCKFAFKRMEGQASLQFNENDAGSEERSDAEEDG